MGPEVSLPRTVREPRPLFAPSDGGASLSCVATNVLYSHGLVDEAWGVPDTDRDIGREPGQPVYSQPVDLMLLGKGMRLTSINAFDSNRFANASPEEARQQLQDYYGDEWDSNFSEYFTDEKIAERQVARRQEKAEYDVYAGQFEDLTRTPTIGDIDILLSDGQQVIVQVNGSGSVDCRSILIYGFAGGANDYRTYTPSQGWDGIGFDTKKWLSEHWLPKEGITGVKLA